jgi:CheY-like chemotaxis protein
MDTLPPKPPHKILIVDDDVSVLEIYTSKFKQEGFDVVAVKDGQEAWDLIRGGYTPEVLYTGIVMPRMTGFDLIRAMRADPRLASIPIAINSHYGRNEDKATAKSLGIDDFLVVGVVPLNEVVRRIKLMMGVQDSFTVRLERGREDDEEIISLLNKQGMTSLGNHGEKLSLELKPQSESGVFRVGLIVENPEQR